MKKIFIIFCNPKENSFSEAIAHTYLKGAKASNNDVRIINIYDLNVEYFSFSDELSPELKEFQNNILWSDELILIYPVWWLSIPAKLKSVIERTFLKSVVAEYSPHGFPIPLLKDKKAIIIQTYDMPVFIMKYLGGDLSFKHLQGILKICGIKVIKRFDFGRMINSTQQKRFKWLQSIENFALKSL